MNTKIIIKGFLSESPVKSASQKGKLYIKLTVASIREENDVRTVDFFNVKAEDKGALYCKLERGMGIVVIGHLVTEKFTYKNNIYNNIRIIADEIRELAMSEEIPQEYIKCMAMGGVIPDEIYNG